MSFTTIHNTTSWQSLQIAKEIRVAYNKRRTACGMSTYPDPDNSIKVRTFVRAIQDGIEEMVTKFGDTTVTNFNGLTALPENYASITAGMTKAKLTIAGFWRRIPMDGHAPVRNLYDEWPEAYECSGWNYGKLQSGDQAGPWLYQDLEQALKALSRIIGQSTSAGTGYTAQYTNGNSGGNSSTRYWTFPDDPVTGNINTTAINDSLSYVISNIDVSKTNYNFLPLINTASAQYNLANFRVFCGHYAVGATRTCKFVALPTGNDSLSAITGITATGITLSSTESVADQSYFNKWFPKSPSALGTLAWQTILDQITDGDVPENETIERSMELGYFNVRSVVDYVWNDGATS